MLRVRQMSQKLLLRLMRASRWLPMAEALSACVPSEYAPAAAAESNEGKQMAARSGGPQHMRAKCVCVCVCVHVRAARSQ